MADGACKAYLQLRFQWLKISIILTNSSHQGLDVWGILCA
jgi:hypothetical protein